MDRRRKRRYLLPSGMLFELTVPATRNDTPLCLARRYPLPLKMACTRHRALESSGGGRPYLRPLPHVVAIVVVRCRGGWHVSALLFFTHCVHTPLGTWVARYGRIRSSPRRCDCWCLARPYPRPPLTYRLPRCYACCSAGVPAPHRRHDESLEERGGSTTGTTSSTQSARLSLLRGTWDCPRKRCS